MTKKEINAIKAAAYAQWAATETGRELLAKEPGNTPFKCWRVVEGGKVAYMHTTSDTQLNKQTLAAGGFSEAARVDYQFTANRQTKTLSWD